MPARPDFDVVVVGGGPAGLATAIGARTAGLAVVVLDRRKPPIDQACGEGIMPEGITCLKTLSVDLPTSSSTPFRGIRYIDGDTVAEGRFPGVHGIGTRRVTLHRALVERAEKIGVELRWGVRATALSSNGVEAGDTFFGGRFVVGADGRGSRVRSWADRDPRRPPPTRFGIRRHYSIEPWTDFVEVHWVDGSEAYITPAGPSTVGIALLWRRGSTTFDQLLTRFPVLCHRLRRAEPASSDRGAAIITRRARAVLRPNLALVGDASGALDPITGEGLTVAFMQARALVHAIVAGDLSLYAAAHRRLTRKPRLLTGLVLIAERHPALRRRLVRAFAADPGLFSRFLAVAATDAPLTGLGPASVLRLLKGLAVA